jgi:hypothetical protein
MLLRMIWKQLVFVSLLGCSCTHETGANGAVDTHQPKAERAPAQAPAAASSESSEDSSASCTSDADCHPVDVYCGGCQCLAMPATTAVPKCQDNEVHCFAQPCRGQRAVCRGGGCSLGGSASGEQ